LPWPPADLGDTGLRRGHPRQSGTGEAVPLEVADAGNLVDEDVGALRILENLGHQASGTTGYEESSSPAQRIF
jgi:hypothetical protein